MKHTNFDHEVDHYTRTILADVVVYAVATVAAIGLALIIADAIFGPEAVTYWLASWF